MYAIFLFVYSLFVSLFNFLIDVRHFWFDMNWIEYMYCFYYYIILKLKWNNYNVMT